MAGQAERGGPGPGELLHHDRAGYPAV